MNREFLKGLGLEKEAIDSIMAEHGKSVQSAQSLNSEIATLETEKAELTTKAKQYDKLKEQNETLTTQLEEAQSDSEKSKRDATIEISLHKAKAKEKYAEFIKKQLVDVDASQIDSKLTELQADMSELFEVEPAEEKPKEKINGFQIIDNRLKEGSEPDGWTKEKIMAIADTKERQRKISEHKDLFK